jgi:hypothetical protein
MEIRVAWDVIMSQRYDLLFACFISEQMSAKQSQEQMEADDVFRRYVERKIKEGNCACRFG